MNAGEVNFGVQFECFNVNTTANFDFTRILIVEVEEDETASPQSNRLRLIEVV